MFKKIAVAALLALVASSSFAAGKKSIYVGLDAGSSKSDDLPDTYTSYGTFAGFQFHENFAVEGGLRRLGSDNRYSIGQTAVSMVGTSYAQGEFSQWNLFARVGINHLSGDGCDYIKCGTKALIGVGIGYAFTDSISGRIEAQRPMLHTSNISAGVSFRF